MRILMQLTFAVFWYCVIVFIIVLVGKLFGLDNAVDVVFKYVGVFAVNLALVLVGGRVIDRIKAKKDDVI